jgi:hypothetical protein
MLSAGVQSDEERKIPGPFPYASSSSSGRQLPEPVGPPPVRAEFAHSRQWVELNAASQGSAQLNFIRIDEPNTGSARGVELPSEVIKLYAPN